MALPSAVTVASLAFVLTAGAGYVVISAAAADTADTGEKSGSPRASRVFRATPSKPIASSLHSSGVHHRRRAVPDVLVELFNNNGIAGRAEQAAAVLQGAGWSVWATDNWYGNIPADTVYYPPALHDEAVRLAKVLHIARLHAAVAPMKFDRLTVILATS